MIFFNAMKGQRERYSRMKYAGNLFYAQPFYSILCHLYNCLPLCFSLCSSFPLHILVSVACPLSRRREQIKWNIFIIYKRFFFGSSRFFCVSCCCCSSSLSLSYILWQRANKLQRLNCLCLLLPSFSLYVSVLFLCLRVDFILNKILYASCVWYMLYIRLIYVHVCVCWASARICHECQAKSRQIVGTFYVLLFVFFWKRGVSHRKSEIMRRSWDLRHEARVRDGGSPVGNTTSGYLKVYR